MKWKFEDLAGNVPQQGSWRVALVGNPTGFISREKLVNTSFMVDLVKHIFGIDCRSLVKFFVDTSIVAENYVVKRLTIWLNMFDKCAFYVCTILANSILFFGHLCTWDNAHSCQEPLIHQPLLILNSTITIGSSTLVHVPMVTRPASAILEWNRWPHSTGGWGFWANSQAA